MIHFPSDSRTKSLLPFLLIAISIAFGKCKSEQKKDIESFDMRTELKRLYDNDQYPLNFSRNDLGIQFFENELKKTTGFGRIPLLGGLANQLLVAGKNDEAIDSFNSLILMTGENEDWLNGLGLAYFRKGEQMNCQFNHNENSCIMPLQGTGLHKFPEGSRGAIEIYKKLLKRSPEDPVALWMLNLAYMTLGLYPDSVPPQYFMDFNKFNSEYSFPRLSNVADNVGLSTNTHFGGAISDDFNGDNYLDIFVTSNPLNENVRLFLSDKEGAYTEATEQANLTGITGGVNALQGDFNNDGNLDIFIMRGGWQQEGGKHPKSLLRNNGNGTFTDITANAGLLDYFPSHSAVFADFNKDGLLDLFVGNETGSMMEIDMPEYKEKPPQYPSKLFMNNGDETFTETASSCGINIYRWVKGVAALDYDNDGWQDLYLSCFNSSNFLFRNNGTDWNGKVSFTDVTEKAGVSGPLFSFPVAVFDINNDGFEDLYVSGYFFNDNDITPEYLQDMEPAYPSFTYLNNGDGTFRNISSTSGPKQSILAMGMNFGDVDNDGFIDLYLGTGAAPLATLYPNVLLKNNGGKEWLDVTFQAGVGHLQKTHGIAFTDLDYDGDLDLYVSIGGLVLGDNFWHALFENPGFGNSWVSINLIGTESNRSAIGSRISVTVEEAGVVKKIYKTVNSGGSYGASPLSQHIGIGAAEKIKLVEIKWTSGKTEQFSDLSPNHWYLIKEGEGKADELHFKNLSFHLPAKEHGHHAHH